MSEVDFTWIVLLLPNWSKHQLNKFPSTWPAHFAAVTTYAGHMLLFHWNKLFAYFLLYSISIVSLAQLVILAKLDQISVGLGDIKDDMSEVDFTWVV